MPVTHVRRQRSEAPAQSSSWENDLSAEARPLSQRRPKRGAAAEGSDEPRSQPHEWPQQLRRAPKRTAVAPETPGQASQRALEELQRALRRRGHKDTEIPQLLQGWTATRERQPVRHTGTYHGDTYQVTDPDGETYRSIVSAACAAEPRAEGEEAAPSLLDETFWEDARHGRFAKLARWQRPAPVRDLKVPPPPDDPVPNILGGFDNAYGDDWTRAKPHPQFVRDDVAAMGGDMDDDRCCRPRTALAVACQAAKMRPPVHRRNVPPRTWRRGILRLADNEPDLARRAELRELERAAAAIDLDCREAAKRYAEKNWPAARCCHVLATLCVFVIRTTEHRVVRIMDCEARLGDDNKIKLTWHGPNKPFDLDHLAWTEIARVLASGRVILFDFHVHHHFIGLSFHQ